MVVWNLFEQSGTFKGVAKELGYESYDVDIRNDFKQTDFKIDLFCEIANETNIIKAHKRNPKILACDTFFSKISADDLVFAFFPCTRFVEKNSLNARCKNGGMKSYTPLQKLDYTMKITYEQVHYYYKLCELIAICYERGFKMILENPYNVGSFNYLQAYFPFEPQVIIRDRTQLGDRYKKPTAFWFFNHEPKQMDSLVPCYNIKHISLRKHESFKKQEKRLSQVEKSLITPEFARNFIKQYVKL